MATESPIRMLKTRGSWTSHKGGRGVVPNRSGSAPPNMEGSLSSIENIMQNSGLRANLTSVGYEREFRGPEEQLVSYSSSVSDYSSYIDLNSKFHHQHLASNSVGRLTSFSGSSDNVLHMSWSSLPTHKEESDDDRSPQKTDRSSAAWSGQDSRDVKNDITSMSSLLDDQSNALHHGTNTRNTENSSLQEQSIGASTTTLMGVHADDLASPFLRSISYDSRQGSSPSIQSEDSSNANILSENKSLVGSESDITSVENRIKALRIACPPNSENHGIRGGRQPNFQNTLIQRPIFQQGGAFQFPGSMPQIVSQGTNNSYIVANQFFLGGNFPSTEAQHTLQLSAFTPPLYMHSSSPYYANAQPHGLIYPPQYSMGGYPYNDSIIPQFLSGYTPHNAIPLATCSDVNTQAPGSWGGSSHGVDIQHTSRIYGHVGFPQPIWNPRLQVQPHHSFGDVYNVPNQLDPLALRGGGVVGNQTTPRREAISVGDYATGGSSPNTGLFMHSPHSPLASPVLPRSPMGSGSFRGGRSDVGSPNSIRSASAYSGWHGQREFEGFGYQKPYPFLEELKSGKGRRFELSDIAGHVVELSVDQHGSRFIQQKLENCSIEDMVSVFVEVLPHASKLMTDVFGNYVIQKFFEYGTPERRRDLANALRSQILPLSLQMYGCRVIQKALDVIEIEQKAELVKELDGHVLKCVRDQNGNHVIQKCIESIPIEKISFVISAFRGHVASLSMHPYGCRVIQRVLERCTSELQSQFIVDEILESVCTLAQDQYGNYVTQHVLERGKPQERTKIIKNLAGQVVKMSQHKFASNVVEKCLGYGEPQARELLIVEVIGQDDGNDNLLVMMKDQYANYVVQKILETCTESQREELLSRIKVHLPALKKYTYGKHIAARFEQLFGEPPQAAEP